ncbi:uncharacterized protein STAUR_6402 [Stigmatella aurantiaca DW4/3-1]|uniref:Uncharacterized protein n=2 Tax=Stigmatella aurantiaca TaxID=41 RepID=Q098N0_STIAD|nr:uncharacterized protein STAUR_6402 [Stigmatella aurantiaca DW4/3-1]EAU68234.1 hypothetical protein STIAU_7765 [Stigmatella aurantiaca DW4/3-1]
MCLWLVVPLVLLGAAPADAQTFTLTSVCKTPCGQDYLGPVWTKPGSALFEEHFIQVRLDAAVLMRSASEHIAISGMASGRPFRPGGTFSPDASNGGVGIALGRIDKASHDACPEDTASEYVELGIEQFGWRDPFASKITACTNFRKSLLASNTTVLLSLSIKCSGNLCAVTAGLTHDGTGAQLASVSGYATVANPTATRNIWYALTNFQGEKVEPSVTFQVIRQTYTAR